MKKILFKSIKEAEIKLIELLSKKDEHGLAVWFNHFRNYYPPIAYKYSRLILENIENKEAHINIVKSCFFVQPKTIEYTKLTRPELIEKIIGEKIDNQIKSKEAAKVIIYSDKLSRRFVSSQECMKPIIERITKEFDCILVHDKNREIDQYYKKLSRSIAIDSNKMKDSAKIVENYAGRNGYLFRLQVTAY